MYRITLLVLLTFYSIANVSAASLLNISSWGYADYQSPHIACSIISAPSSQKVLLLVYAEANLSYNNRTDPEVYVGRPGNPLTSPNSYVYNDDWDTGDTSAMIQSVGRTPNNYLDSGVFISAPSGPICFYAYEYDMDGGLGRINAQVTYLGILSSSNAERSSTTSEAKVEKASQADILELFNKDPALPDAKMLPIGTDIVTTTPDRIK